jgi:uncharacterized protein Yka (UPF0111/DUF47 family)
VPRLPNVLRSSDGGWFDPFERAADNVQRAAQLLEQMLREHPEQAHLAREIFACEQEGDRLTAAVMERQDGRSPAPLERQDAVALASGLDDVVDLVEEVADYFVIYKIEAPMDQAQRLAQILLEACGHLVCAVAVLRERGDAGPAASAVRALETEGDRVARDAIASLFDTGIDPMVVIRWKDIFERLEEAIDATEHVANVLGGIALRRG